MQGRTNADLVDWALRLKSALNSCNNDKQAVQEWYGNKESKNGN